MAQATPQQPTPQQKPSVTSVRTGLDTSERQELAQAVGKTLAETYVLYAKTQAVHWNVVGPMFYSVHKLTEEQYKDLADAVDDLAERIRALGAPTPASYNEFLKLSDIRETSERQTAEDAIRMLCADHETAARSFREVARRATEMDDVVTADLLTTRMARHEKAAWMLRALLQESAVLRASEGDSGQAGGGSKSQRQ